MIRGSMIQMHALDLLDLYAACDIPETEVFRDTTPDTLLLSKFASSAAHVAGKSLVSSETGTWIREHFHVMTIS